MYRNPVALSLFWRTFFLITLLLACGVGAWVQTARVVELEPRDARDAHRIATVVGITKTALKAGGRDAEVQVAKTLAGQGEGLLMGHAVNDRWEPLGSDRAGRSIVKELREQLGPNDILASSVNAMPGLWVGFSVGDQAFWLDTGYAGSVPVAWRDMLPWAGLALLATVLGSALIAQVINRPLQDLSFAASRIRDGEFDSRLDENTRTNEIREVNKGFNRMARELAKVEEDRAVMLAGISHDLRTPLARLRLEAEMSVHDEEAKQNMVLDIDQLDQIIDKFMDYARPGDVVLVPVRVAQVFERESAAFRNPNQIKFSSGIKPETRVMADETELGRVLQNLFENARRYGRSPDTGIANVQVLESRSGAWVNLTVRDFGRGVDSARLKQLTTPFFRGDVARTSATGAGLGLTIVEKSVQRMGGTLEIANATGGGLVVQIRLRNAN